MVSDMKKEKGSRNQTHTGVSMQTISKWQKQFPWLKIDSKSGSIYMGCSICAKFGSKTKFGRSLVTSLNRSVIDLHAGSPAHLSCSDTRQKKRHVPYGEAPSTEYFRKLIDKVKGGQATLRDEARQTFCVAEALKSRNQEVAGSSEAMGIMRDESQGRLTLRLKSVNKRLKTHFGYVGTVIGNKQDAQSITSSTKKILENFSSRWLGAPTCGARPPGCKPFVKKHLFAKVRKNIQVLDVDSASNEVVSGEMMRNSLLWKENSDEPVVTPNLKVVLKDAAHSRRRTISRPWNADQNLKRIALKFALGRGTMPFMLQHSEDHRQIFKKKLAERGN